MSETAPMPMPTLYRQVALAVFLVFFLLSRAAVPSVVETRDGKRYQDCQSFKVEGDHLSFLHGGGRSRVPIAQIQRMPAEARTLLGLVEEDKFLRTAKRDEDTTRFLKAHTELRKVGEELKSLEAEGLTRIRFVVLEQVDPRAVGLVPIKPEGEIYRVQINDGSASGPNALLETRGERVFTKTDQELPVVYIRKVPLQRVGFATGIVPLFRETGAGLDEKVRDLQSQQAALRREIQTLALALHPGEDCPSCLAGKCADCSGGGRLLCKACGGTRFGPSRPLTKPCAACRGKGVFERINSEPATCRSCKGTGAVAAGTTQDPCPACVGKGQVACGTCQGKGLCVICQGRGSKPPVSLDQTQIDLLRDKLAAPPSPGFPKQTDRLDR